MTKDRQFNEDAWSLRKALLSTIRQSWYQVDVALYGIAATERSQVSDALRSLELAIFKAELDNAKESVGYGGAVQGEATKP